MTSKMAKKIPPVFSYTPEAGFANNGFKVGDIRFISSSVIPAGWLVMDGSNRSKTTYADLYNFFLAEGFGVCRYGEELVAGTFRLPDARGRALRFTALGSTNDPDRLSRTDWNGSAGAPFGGDGVGTLQAYQTRIHSHGVPKGNASFVGGFYYLSTNVGPSGLGNTQTENYGGNETRGINIAFTGIICYNPNV